jgi:hypothetical protein
MEEDSEFVKERHSMTQQEFFAKYFGPSPTAQPFIAPVVEVQTMSNTVVSSRGWACTNQCGLDFVSALPAKYAASMFWSLPVMSGNVWYAVQFNPPKVAWASVNGANANGDPATASFNIATELYSYFTRGWDEATAWNFALGDIDGQLAMASPA